MHRQDAARNRRRWQTLSTLLIVLATLLIVLAASGVAWLVWWVLVHFARTLALVGIAGIIAFLLEPAVTFMAQGMRSRTLAALLLYLGFVALLGLGIVYLAGPIKDQAQELFWAVPRYREQVAQAVPLLESYLRTVEDYLAQYGISLAPEELAGRFLQQVAGNTNRILGAVTALITAVSNTVANFLLVLVISLYLVIDGSLLNRRLLSYIPEAQRPVVRRVQAVCLQVFGNYLRGQLLLGLIIGVSVGWGMSWLGMPYPALLGVIAGVMELIPIIGAILGAIPAVLIALFQPWPTVIYVTLFFVVVQQVEGNLLVPRITGQAVGMHPLPTLLVLLAGYEVAGLLGAILAVPVAAVAYALFREFHPLAGPEGPGGGGTTGGTGWRGWRPPAGPPRGRGPRGFDAGDQDGPRRRKTDAPWRLQPRPKEPTQLEPGQPPPEDPHRPEPPAGGPGSRGAEEAGTTPNGYRARRQPAGRPAVTITSHGEDEPPHFAGGGDRAHGRAAPAKPPVCSATGAGPRPLTKSPAQDPRSASTSL